MDLAIALNGQCQGLLVIDEDRCLSNLRNDSLGWNGHGNCGGLTDFLAGLLSRSGDGVGHLLVGLLEGVRHVDLHTIDIDVNLAIALNGQCQGLLIVAENRRQRDVGSTDFLEDDLNGHILLDGNAHFRIITVELPVHQPVAELIAIGRNSRQFKHSAIITHLADTTDNSAMSIVVSDFYKA